MKKRERYRLVIEEPVKKVLLRWQFLYFLSLVVLTILATRLVLIFSPPIGGREIHELSEKEVGFVWHHYVIGVFFVIGAFLILAFESKCGTHCKFFALTLGGIGTGLICDEILLLVGMGIGYFSILAILGILITILCLVIVILWLRKE